MSTTPINGALDTKVIEDKLSTPSDHEVVFCDLPDPDGITARMVTSLDITEWGVKAISDYRRKAAAKAWHFAIAERCQPVEDYTTMDFEDEAKKIETTLMTLLDNYATPLQVTACFKRWLTSEVAANRNRFCRS